MDAVAPGPRDDRPLHVIEDAYEHAFAALADPHAPQMDAVIWLCVHLSAVQHVVQRELARFLAAHELAAFRHGGVQLERTLRTLEQLESKDALVSHVDAGLVLRSLINQVRGQADREHLLLLQLAKRLSAPEQRRLVADYERALVHAPTRPHPHAPHGRVLGALAFHINASRDRIMDTLDSRPIPTPHRPRKPVKSSRWGDYLIGASHIDSRHDSR
jgi:hypothetical protein